MEYHLKIVGALLVTLAVMHIALPKYFKWGLELSSLTLITRQIVYVHTFFIALIILLMGSLCIVSSSEIVNTRLGHQISCGLFIFWVARLIFQLFVYSIKTWKGKAFETIMHVFFSALWTYFGFVFFKIAWS